ncbi:MmcQ/YjbR family DNA-binding protein [Paenibacillus cymbidii]|uniref:MmcQ/YjbR family DNA-binding protein n=1 Tax=Paenibacillus cymbidii TaxID=1639034 RepID=UPI00108026B9|nr:MmcQ/YjbR family DNA-binding protein [Paenibacillus cymbidii]
MEHSSKKILSEEGLAMESKVRSIVAGLPEAEETIDGFGHTVFKVRGKTFVMMGETGEGTGLSIKATKESQELLLALGGFVKTPYIGHHGWVSLAKGTPPDWSRLEELLVEGYALAAPKRLARQWKKDGGNQPD